MKTDYIRVRMSDKDKELIKSGAEARGMTMSEYILYLVRREADKKAAD